MSQPVRLDLHRRGGTAGIRKTFSVTWLATEIANYIEQCEAGDAIVIEPLVWGLVERFDFTPSSTSYRRLPKIAQEHGVTLVVGRAEA